MKLTEPTRQYPATVRSRWRSNWRRKERRAKYAGRKSARDSLDSRKKTNRWTTRQRVGGLAGGEGGEEEDEEEEEEETAAGFRSMFSRRGRGRFVSTPQRRGIGAPSNVKHTGKNTNLSGIITVFKITHRQNHNFR